MYPSRSTLNYVADSDPGEDPAKDPGNDQADYPVDGRDCDNEPFDDDDDDDADDEDPQEEPFEGMEDDEEEEEHLAPADSSAVPVVYNTRLRRAQKTVRPEPPIPTDTEAPLGYRAAEIRMRALLPSTSRRTGILEADMPPQRRACLTTPSFGFKIGESFDEIVDTLMAIAPTTLEGDNERVTELDTTIRQRMDEFEIRLEVAQDDRDLLGTQVNTLFRDRPDHRRTAMLMDIEAMYAHEA
nr:hypothetical protein [Tanacetum cinerariifolium]